MPGGSPLWPMAADEVQKMREVQREYSVRAFGLSGRNYAPTAKGLGSAVSTLKSYLGRG